MTPTRNLWPGVDEQARSQHGLITYEQLQVCEFTEAMVRQAVRIGQLIRLHRGVFRTIGMPPSHAQLLLAATMRMGSPAAASHRSAAHLWGLRPDIQRLEISVPHTVQTRPRNVIVHRSRDLDPNHFTHRSGIPVTKPARTIIDLASVLRPEQLCEVVDRALVLHLVSQRGLRTMIDELRRPGRPGPATVRRILDQHPLGDVRPESVLEPVMAAIVRTSGVADRIVYQHTVQVRGRTFRMDFAAPHVKLGVEVLGLREHGTRQAVVDDSERRRLLRLEGWELLEYTLAAMRRSPTRVAREIASFVEKRERQFPGWTRIA